MSTPFTATFHPAQHPPTDTGLGIASIVELITHSPRVNEHHVRGEAAVGHDGYIALDVTQIGCTGEDLTIRMLLCPTATIEPGPDAA